MLSVLNRPGAPCSSRDPTTSRQTASAPRPELPSSCCSRRASPPATALSADGRYSIDAVTGQIRTALELNFEAGNSRVGYSVYARDHQGAAGYLQAASSVTIAIGNVNEANSLPST